MNKFIELTYDDEKHIVNVDYIKEINDSIRVYRDPNYIWPHDKEMHFTFVYFSNDKSVIVKESYEDLKKKLMDATAEPSKETKEEKNND